MTRAHRLRLTSLAAAALVVAATCGHSTANRGFTLSDGATLVLTVATMADRTKHPYGDSVLPDETVADRSENVRRAAAWLESGQLRAR